MVLSLLGTGAIWYLAYRESGALAALDDHPQIALVFTDVVMPGGMSGVELRAAARARRPDLKILFTSGYPEHATRNGSALHDAEILGNPYRKSELARKLRELLDGDGR